MLQATPDAGLGRLEDGKATDVAAERMYKGRSNLYHGEGGLSHAGYMGRPTGERAPTNGDATAPEAPAKERSWWDPDKWMRDLLAGVGANSL